ncbi:hypothetical protein Tco_0321055 [Tanacetum coccineum]
MDSLYLFICGERSKARWRGDKIEIPPVAGGNFSWSAFTLLKRRTNKTAKANGVLDEQTLISLLSFMTEMRSGTGTTAIEADGREGWTPGKLDTISCGFAGDGIDTLGKIELEVCFGNEGLSRVDIKEFSLIIRDHILKI